MFAYLKKIIYLYHEITFSLTIKQRKKTVYVWKVSEMHFSLWLSKTSTHTETKSSQFLHYILPPLKKKSLGKRGWARKEAGKEIFSYTNYGTVTNVSRQNQQKLVKRMPSITWLQLKNKLSHFLFIAVRLKKLIDSYKY
jgi:hypothetical protein